MAPKPRKAKFVRANFAYVAKEVDELSFEEGDLLYILDWTTDPEWWKARCRGKEGLVPANFLNKSKDGGDDDEPNPFHDACKRGNIELLEECLLNKIPVNQADKSGNTGLQWACRGGHSHIGNFTHYSKSQIFVQKFNFDKSLQFSREIKVVNN